MCIRDRVIKDAYLAKVKTKDQVKEEWDLEQIVTTVPAAQAYGEPQASCKMGG